MQFRVPCVSSCPLVPILSLCTTVKSLAQSSWWPPCMHWKTAASPSNTFCSTDWKSSGSSALLTGQCSSPQTLNSYLFVDVYPVSGAQNQMQVVENEILPVPNRGRESHPFVFFLAVPLLTCPECYCQDMLLANAQLVSAEAFRFFLQSCSQMGRQQSVSSHQSFLPRGSTWFLASFFLVP